MKKPFNKNPAFAQEDTTPSEQLFWTVTDAATDGADPLYNAVDGDICLHVIKQSYPAEEGNRLAEACRQLVIRTDNSSGGGDGYGQASQNMSSGAEAQALSPDCAVVRDGAVIGAVVKGSWNQRIISDRESYACRIFLPIAGKPQKIEYTYSYDVYVFDGTSSEYSRRVYATVERVRRG